MGDEFPARFLRTIDVRRCEALPTNDDAQSVLKNVTVEVIARTPDGRALPVRYRGDVVMTEENGTCRLDLRGLTAVGNEAHPPLPAIAHASCAPYLQKFSITASTGIKPPPIPGRPALGIKPPPIPTRTPSSLPHHPAKKHHGIKPPPIPMRKTRKH